MARALRKDDPDDGQLRMRFPKEPCDRCGSPTQWATRSGYRACPNCVFKEALPKLFVDGGKGAA